MRDKSAGKKKDQQKFGVSSCAAPPCLRYTFKAYRKQATSYLQTNIILSPWVTRPPPRQTVHKSRLAESHSKSRDVARKCLGLKIPSVLTKRGTRKGISSSAFVTHTEHVYKWIICTCYLSDLWWRPNLKGASANLFFFFFFFKGSLKQC